MIDRLQKHLESGQLIPRDFTVLVAYSGGPDSACLLHSLHQLGYAVVAAHLHHGMRPEADKEQALCQAFCQELGVPFVAGRADVPLMSRELKISLEEAGRHARYTFLRRAQHQMGTQLIATGHTRTDSVETVLFNLARGTGPTGLSGIPANRDGLIRPLLPFSKSETRAYCEAEGLWYHDDPANCDERNRRVLIRQRIAPALEEINPAFEQAIARASGIIAEEDRFLNGMAAAALERCEALIPHPLGFLSQSVEAEFESSALGHLPAVLFKRAIRLAVQSLGAELNYDQVELVAERFGRQSGSVTAEGGRVCLEWNDARLTVRDVTQLGAFRYAVTYPGETFADEFGWQITAQPMTLGDAVAVPARNALSGVFSTENVKGQLYFRNAQSGDQMQPSGFDGRRKLADLMGEAKVSPAVRQRLPVVCDLIGPLWVPGVCYDQRLRPEPGHRRGIELVFGPIQSQASHN